MVKSYCVGKSAWISIVLVVCMVTSSFVMFVASSSGSDTGYGSGGIEPSSAKRAARMTFQGLPESVTAGTPLGFVLTVLDKSGRICDNYKGTVEFWSSDAMAAVPPRYTFLKSENGQHWFPNGSLVFSTAGSQVLLAYDVKHSKISGGASIVIVPNAPPVAVITVDSIVGMTVSVDGRNSYDPDGSITWYAWTWGDGSMPTVPSNQSAASHDYLLPGGYTIVLQVFDDRGETNSTRAVVTVAPLPPPEPSKTTTIYDMFQQPWGDWWSWRYKGYRTDLILSNVTGEYTMLYNPDRRGNQGIIYAPYRMNITATNVSQLSAHNPEFMPVLGAPCANGSEAVMDAYFQYLDWSWWNSYWGPVWHMDDNIMWAQVSDGWYSGVTYSITMNRQAAEEWLGIPRSANPLDWWATNGRSYMVNWSAWILNEGNSRLDVWAAWEFPLIDDGTKMKLSVLPDGKISLQIGALIYGYEILMTRWLTEAGLCDHEPFYEDMSLHVDYRQGQTDFAFDAVCQYSLHAVRANETSNGSAWVWEPNAIDYVPSWNTPGGMHKSRYDPYANLTYTSWNAGDPIFGQEVLYESTPTWFNLTANSKLIFELPAGNNVIGYEGTGVPLDAIKNIIRYKDYSAYDNITLHGAMSLGYWAVSANSTGGPDLSTMYDPVSRTLTITGPLCFDNVRHPNGALYHGAPWIEFDVGAAEGPMGWQSPTLLQSVIEYEQMGSVGMDDDGDAIVLWEQPFGWSNYSDQGAAIWSIRYDHVSGWGSPVKVWDGPFACGYTTLGVGPHGEAVAAWFAAAPPYDSALYLSLYHESMGWLPPTVLQAGNGYNYGFMDADIDESGNAMVVVQGSPGQALTAWRYDNMSGVWNGDVIVSSGSAWPRVRYDATGCAIVVWNDFDHRQVKSCRYVPGSGWGPIMIASGSTGGYWVELDVDDTGRGLAAFFIYNGTAWDMYGNIFDPVTGWGVPAHIGPVAGGWHPFGGFVAAGAPGEFFVVWEQTDDYASGGNRTVWSRIWRESDGWSEAVKLNSGASRNNQMFTSIAAAENGEAFASWTQGDSVMEDVVAVRYTPATGWGVPEVIDSTDAYRAYLSSLAMAPNGDAVAIWRQYDGETDLLWGRAFLAGTVPPSNRPPVAVIEVESIVGLSVCVSGNSSYDPDGTIAWYSWTWGDGTPPTSPSAVPSASHTYVATGNYTIRLQVADDLGASALAHVNVTVVKSGNIPPVAVITVDSIDGLIVHVSGRSSYDLDGTVSWYSWSWREGGPWTNLSATSSATIYYGAAGTYRVGLRVVDNDGDSATAYVYVTVTDLGAWSPPESIGIGSSLMEHGEVSLDSNTVGYAIAAWSGTFGNGDLWGVFTRRYLPGEGWHGTEFAGLATPYTYAPCVGIDESGNITVAWICDSTICSKRYSFADNLWEPVVNITATAAHPSQLTMAVEGRGLAVIAWEASDGAQWSIFASTRRVGNVWSVPALIESRTGYAGNPSAAITEGGDAMVAFSVSGGSQSDIFVNRYSAMANQWLGESAIEDLAGYATLPRVSMDLYGNAFVVWDQAENLGGRFYYKPFANVFLKGLGWGQPSDIGGIWGEQPSSPDVAAYGNANAVSSWTVVIAGSTTIRTSRFMNGSSWIGPTSIAWNCTNAFRTSISTDQDGYAYVAWSQSDGSENVSGYYLMACNFIYETGWSAPSIVGWATNTSGPKVAAGPANTAIMVWNEFGAYNDVWSSEFVLRP